MDVPVFTVFSIIHDDKIKEGFQLGVSVPFGGLGIILGYDLKEMEEVFAADWIEVSLSKELLEIDQQVPVAYDGVPLKVWFLVVSKDLQCGCNVHRWSSFVI